MQRTEHIYDGYNRLSRQSWTLGGKTYSESYVYDDPSDTKPKRRRRVRHQQKTETVR